MIIFKKLLVSELENGSFADLQGVRNGDVLLSVNGSKLHDLKLEEVKSLFKTSRKTGKVIILFRRQKMNLPLQGFCVAGHFLWCRFISFVVFNVFALCNLQNSKKKLFQMSLLKLSYHRMKPSLLHNLFQPTN